MAGWVDLPDSEKLNNSEQQGNASEAKVRQIDFAITFCTKTLMKIRAYIVICIVLDTYYLGAYAMSKEPAIEIQIGENGASFARRYSSYMKVNHAIGPGFLPDQMDGK